MSGSSTPKPRKIGAGSSLGAVANGFRRSSPDFNLLGPAKVLPVPLKTHVSKDFHQIFTVTGLYRIVFNRILWNLVNIWLKTLSFLPWFLGGKSKQEKLNVLSPHLLGKEGKTPKQAIPRRGKNKEIPKKKGKEGQGTA